LRYINLADDTLHNFSRGLVDRTLQQTQLTIGHVLIVQRFPSMSI